MVGGMKVELKGFPDRLDMGYERERSKLTVAICT